MSDATENQTDPTPETARPMPEGFDTQPGHKSGFITIVGRPNVGKSTLLNALLKQKIAIVSPRPQTTRQRQLGIITRPAYQMIFIDTPGMMRPRHKLDAFMMDSAVDTLTDADVILWLVDGSEPPGPGDKAIARQLQETTVKEPDVQVILGINKADLVAPDEVVPRTDAYRALLPGTTWIFFSATQGNGRDELYQMLVDALPEGPRYYPPDQITDAYVRDIAAELVREQIMLQLKDEVPYGTAVRVEEYKERENGTAYISATIFVERDNHKAIIIGAKGSQLRALGKAARKEIEAMVGNKVFLELWVKVEPKWRKSERALKKLGYTSDE